MTDLVVRKDETLQHNLLPSGCSKRGFQVSQGDGRSAFRVSRVDVAERIRPDFMTDARAADLLHDVRGIPGQGGIDARAGVKVIPIAREPGIGRVGEQIGMRVAVAIAHAPLEHEMADHRPGRRDVVAVEERQQRWDMFPFLTRLVLERGEGKPVELSPRQFQIETHHHRAKPPTGYCQPREKTCSFLLPRRHFNCLGDHPSNQTYRVTFAHSLEPAMKFQVLPDSR